MITLSEAIGILARHRQELRDVHHVREIWIFGSFARGDQTPLSDIDIMVSFDQPVGWEIVDLQQYLEELLGIRVDLVTKRAVQAKPMLWQAVEKELISV